MNALRSPARLSILSFVFTITLYNVYCSETTFNKQVIVQNEIQEKARKDVSTSLNLHQFPDTAKVNKLERTFAQVIFDINKKIKRGKTYQTSESERSRHPSAVDNIPVDDINETNGTDVILNLDNNVRRSARQVPESQRCQRLPLKINFRDIQMAWINSPKEYNAFYCDGQCNHPLVEEGVTNHAKFQSNLHFQKPNEVKDPCCVPTELSDLEITYFVGRTETRETMKNMVVEKCGCR